MVKILDPFLSMRKDGNRVIVYPKGEATFKKSYDFSWRIIHPRCAIVLSLFDGRRSDNDVIDIWGRLNQWDQEQSRKDVSATLQKYNDIMIETNKVPANFHPSCPEDLVCDARSYDMTVSRLNIPTNMLYLPTMQCGHRCRYCYADITPQRSSDELALQEIESILDQCVEHDFANVSLSGGDPFLRKDIFEIIHMLYERGFRADIPTKTALSLNQIRRLRDIGVRNIQISLDSPIDAKVVEYHTGKKNYFSKIMQTLALLGQEEFEIGITCVLTKLNIDSVPDIVAYFGNLGFINRISFAPASASIYRSFPDLYAEPEKLEHYADMRSEFLDRYPHMYIKLDALKDVYFMTVEERKEWYDNRATCSGGRFAFVLLPNGKVTLCEELYYEPEFIVGDLRKQTIVEMWHSSEMLSVMDPDQEEFIGSPCYECEEFRECHTTKGRCWKRALKAYREKENAPFWPDPFCPHAPRVKERLS